MNKILAVIAGFIIINLVFSSIPYLAPRMPNEVILPYQLWFNVLLIFFIILPKTVGNFSILYKN